MFPSHVIWYSTSQQKYESKQARKLRFPWFVLQGCPREDVLHAIASYLGPSSAWSC